MLFWSVRDHHECGKYFNTNLSNPRRRFKLTTTRGKIELPLVGQTCLLIFISELIIAEGFGGTQSHLS